MADFGQDLTLIESRARAVSDQCEALERQAEFLKVESLQHYLEEQRKELARDRGFRILLKNKKKARDSLLVAAGSVILGGLITKDKLVALNAGMAGFDAAIQGLEEVRWFVFLGKRVLVAAEDSLPSKHTWFTWEG